MATTITMPQLGYDMQEGTVVKWRKGEGEEVSRGEVIAEIETDKAVVEMEAYAGGILRKLVVAEGKTVPVGTLIAVITAPDEEMPPLEALEGAAAPSASEDASKSGAEAAIAPPRPSPAKTEVRASPIARRLAQERGIDLAKITGTGSGGRITEADIEAYKEGPGAAPAPTPGAVPLAEQRIQLTRMRQAIASRTSQSNREAPHFYVTTDIDMGKAMDIRRDLNEGLPEGIRVSVNDLIVKACAQAIGKFPHFNASFQGDHLEVSPNINIGIAIALEDGLIVASIPDCQDRPLVDIARASRDLVERAHGGTLRAEEYTGSTFAISNLGMYDVDSFAAIIFPPHAAVVAIGSVKEQPVVKNGQITVAQMMKATISVDHRVVDGAEAAQFLQEIKRLLEHPVSLVV